MKKILFSDFAQTKEFLDSILIRESITYNIPTDFNSLQVAVDMLSRKIRPNQIEIVLNIESGYRLPMGDLGIKREASLYVSDGDYSMFRITSDDAVVEVADNFEGSIFRCERGRNIVLDCLIDMKGKGFDGYTAEKCSQGYVNVDSGVMNAGRIGLYARQASLIFAARGAEDPSGSGVVFTGAQGHAGCYTNHGSTSYLRGGNFSNATREGIRSRHASMVDAPNTNCSNCGRGYWAHTGSTINANNGNANNANGAEAGVFASKASVVNFENGSAENISGNALMAESSSVINGRFSTLSTSANSAYVKQGSNINLGGAKVNGNPVTESDINIENFNTLTGKGTIFHQ